MGQIEKPWEAIGMSRSTWYRHGKPASKPHRVTLEQAAKAINVSVRSLQRAHRVMRLAPELCPLIDQGVLKLGLAEEIAQSSPRKRRRILKMQIEKSESQRQFFATI